MSLKEFAEIPHFICEVIEKWAKKKPSAMGC